MRVTLFGAGTERLRRYAHRLDWLIERTPTAVDVLDAAERSALTVLGPGPDQAAAALEMLRLLRGSGHSGRILFLVHLDPDEMYGHPLCIEARERGANMVQSQWLSDTVLALLAAELSGTAARLPALGPTLVYGDLRVDDGGAYRGDQPLDLSHTELMLLRLFLENIGVAFSPAQIAAHICGGQRSPDTPRKYVNTLRHKIGDPTGEIIRRNALGCGIGI